MGSISRALSQTCMHSISSGFRCCGAMKNGLHTSLKLFFSIGGGDGIYQVVLSNRTSFHEDEHQTVTQSKL